MYMKWKILLNLKRKYKRENKHIPDCREHKLMFVLTNPEYKEDLIACFTDAEGKDAYFYNPYAKKKAWLVMGFDIEEHFFELLDEYDIEMVSFDAHYSLWDYTEEIYEYSQELPENLGKYLKFCKKKPAVLLLLRMIVGKDTMRFIKNKEGVK